MWDRLLALFKNKPVTNEIHYVIPDVQTIEEAPKPIEHKIEAPVAPIISAPSVKMEGPSTHMGFNYLKGLDDEDDISQPRKFINLNKLLRGDYKYEQIEKASRK